jgi:dolichol-phosphate mannosyltransferase
MADDGAGTLVVTPTYNEAGNLPRLLEGIFRVCPACRVLVVDDASPDGTGLLAEELRGRFPHLSVLHRPEKAGLGAAYRQAFRRALEMGADRVVTMDADLSHDPGQLPDLVAALEAHDVAVGSRYLRGIAIVNWPLGRLCLSRAANWYARAVTRLPVRDCTAGFVAYRREVLERLPLEGISSRGYGFQVEMKYLAMRAGFRLTEVPIVFTERSQGKSKMSGSVIGDGFLRVLLLPFTARRLLRRGARRPGRGQSKECSAAGKTPSSTSSR